MKLDVIELTKRFVSIPSVSRVSNAPISDAIKSLFAESDWVVEESDYIDKNGERKVNLVAKLGQGTGGLAFCSHNDTVPGQEHDWPAFTPEIRDGKLYGRGSCDMKGPLAATLVAALSIDPDSLKKPIYIVVTSDEEISLVGAKFLSETSEILRRDRPEYGVIAEPSSMVPVYSHKGFCTIRVKSVGRSAHSSTGLGESALIKAIPFLSYLADLDKMLQEDSSFMNPLYQPPHHTLNLTIDSGEAAINVMAPETKINISIRGMPNSRTDELIELIEDKARGYGFDVSHRSNDPLFTPIDSELVQLCVELIGEEPVTVSYGTDGCHLMNVIDQLLILGPGDIARAHAIDEFVPIDELHQAVSVYKQLIERLCQ